MPDVQIVIDVSGEAAGAPSVAREFPFSKLAASPVVDLSLADTTGINSFLWEIIDQPYPLVTPISFADPTLAQQQFTLTELISGTFLFRCTVNGGEAFGNNGLAFLTQNRGFRQPSAFEVREFDQVRGWQPSLYDVIAAMDALISPSVPLAGNETLSTVSPGPLVVGGGVFDGTLSGPLSTVQFRAVSLWSPTGSAGDVEVRLYDRGAPGATGARVLRATLTIPFAAAGVVDAYDLPLTVTSSPGVDADEIFDTARVYEVEMEIVGAVGPTADLFTLYNASIDIS